MKLTWIVKVGSRVIEYTAEAESIDELIEIMDRVKKYRSGDSPSSIEKQLKDYESTRIFSRKDFQNKDLEEFMKKHADNLIKPEKPWPRPRPPRSTLKKDQLI